MSKFPSTPLAELKAQGRYSMVGGPFGSKLVSRDYVESGVPVIRGGNLPFGRRFSFEDMVYVTEEKVEADLAGNLAFPGDIVVTQRGTLGQVGLIPEDSPHSKFVVSQSQMKLTVDRSKADPLFVYYALKSPVGQHEIHSRAITAGVPHINLSLFQKLQMPMPPLPIQRKIVAILSAYDDLIENNNRRIKLLEEMAQRIYREWFVDFRYPGHESVPLVDSELGPVPEGWAAQTLGDSCSLMQAGGTPSRGNPRYWTDGTVDWFKTTELQDGFLQASREKVAEAAIKDRKTRVFPKGAILMAIYGSPTVGRLGVLTEPGACNQAALAMVGCTIPQVVLYYALTELRTHFNSIAQGAAQQNISKQKVEETLVVCPPTELCKLAENFIAPMWEQQKTLSLVNSRLQGGRNILLPRLISGEIDVTNLDIAMPEAVA